MTHHLVDAPLNANAFKGLDYFSSRRYGSHTSRRSRSLKGTTRRRLLYRYCIVFCAIKLLISASAGNCVNCEFNAYGCHHDFCCLVSNMLCRDERCRRGALFVGVPAGVATRHGCVLSPLIWPTWLPALPSDVLCRNA